MNLSLPLFLLLVLSGVGRAADLPGPWQTLENCNWIEAKSNDGDSFHVRKGGQEYIFRLYYVDTPELKEMKLTDRTSDQAKYFKIFKRDLYLVSIEAKAFTRAMLTTPFQVQTRWEDAKGHSALPRHYAVITVQGRDLASLLVENGLARINGYPAPHPDGRSGKEVKAELKKLEGLAKEKKLGAWAYSKPKKM